MGGSFAEKYGILGAEDKIFERFEGTGKRILSLFFSVRVTLWGAPVRTSLPPLSPLLPWACSSLPAMKSVKDPLGRDFSTLEKWPNAAPGGQLPFSPQKGKLKREAGKRGGRGEQNGTFSRSLVRSLVVGSVRCCCESPKEKLYRAPRQQDTKYVSLQTVRVEIESRKVRSPLSISNSIKKLVFLRQNFDPVG